MAVTKEDLIKAAYGPYYDLVKPHINTNGWLSLDHIRKKPFEDCYDTLHIEFSFSERYWRPSALALITLNDNLGLQMAIMNFQKQQEQDEHEKERTRCENSRSVRGILDKIRAIRQLGDRADRE